MFKNIDLFEEEPFDLWRKEYWQKKHQTQSSVETVLKERDKEKESKDFHQAQLDISKDILPEQTKGNDRVRMDLFDQQRHRDEDFASKDDKMKMTPTEAFQEAFPSGNSNPQSAAMNPTSSIAEYPASGYSGKDGIPQGKIGSIQLEVKGEGSRWIGDNYLPAQTQDYKNIVVMPKQQVSSSSVIEINIGELIEQARAKAKS